MITDQELDKGFLTLQIIWFAMMLSVVIYFFVGLYFETNVHLPMKEEALDILRPFLYLIALITLVVTRYVRRLFLSAKGQYHQPLGQGFQHPAFRRYLIAMIVALGMSESIGVYGLVLFLLGKNRMDLYLLILVSAAAIFLYRPRRDEVIELT
jgi:hypothetical protein